VRSVCVASPQRYQTSLQMTLEAVTSHVDFIFSPNSDRIELILDFKVGALVRN